MNYDPISGWDRTSTSALGGQRGKRTDAAIDEITAASPEIGALLPRFIQARFWAGPDKVFSIGSNGDPDRYTIPDESALALLGLNADQAQQIVWNLQARVNFYAMIGVQSGGGFAGWVQTIFRGVLGGVAMPKYDPTQGGSFIPTGNNQPLTPVQAAQGDMTFGRARPFELFPGVLGHMFPQPDNNAIAFDHFTADIWFNVETDLDIARLYRQFAIRYGVNVAAEPTP